MEHRYAVIDGDAMIDQALADREGLTTGQVRAELRRSFLGREGFHALHRSGKLRVVAGQARLPLSVLLRGRPMVAWHGSPHLFDQFSTEKINTGEGGQGYGFGLYFAESRDVAEWYRRQLSGDRLRESTARPQLEKMQPAPDNSNAHRLMVLISKNTALNDADIKSAGLEPEDFNFSDVDDEVSVRNLARYDYGAYDAIRGIEANGKKYDAYMFRDGSMIADDGQKIYAIEGPRGALYKVELAPGEDEYLLWDKPLSQQSEKVKAAFRAARKKNRTFSAAVHGWSAKTGQRVYRFLMSHMDGGDKSASEYLHSLGIRGIKYLDERSRGVQFQLDWADDEKGNYDIKHEAEAAMLMTNEDQGKAVEFLRQKGKDEAAFALQSGKLVQRPVHHNYVVFNDADVVIRNRFFRSGPRLGGVYDDQTGRLWLIADAMESGMPAFVMRHEGLHMIMCEDPFFVRKRSRILGRFERLRETDPAVDAAFARVPKDTAPELVTEEAWAYFVTEPANHRHSLFRRFVSAVKVWLFRHHIPTTDLNDTDFVTLADQGVRRHVRRLGKGAPESSFSPAPAGARCLFLGETAETADPHALATAQEMLAAGRDPDGVRRETGWFQGEDEKWRFEIDDSRASLKKPFPSNGYLWGDIYDSVSPPEKAEAVLLGDLLDHPALFAAYPSLAILTVTKQPGKGASYLPRASIDPPMISIGDQETMSDVLSVVLHELQHVVQEREGFAPGGSPGKIGEQLDSALYPLNRKISELARAGQFSSPDCQAFRVKREAIIDRMWEMDNPDAAFDNYRRLAGEVEARNTVARRKLTPEQRRAAAPDTTADVPAVERIIVWRGLEDQLNPRRLDDLATIDRKYLDLAKDPEKNQAELQRMVDEAAREAGYTVGPVFHGTDSDFTVFAADKIGEATGVGDLGEGFYFSESEEFAREFGEKIVPAYIRANFLAGNIVISDSRVQDAIDDGMGFKSVGEVLGEMGYDGIRHDRGSGRVEIVVFAPEQIKSAGPITYDNQGNIIPLSQRFDPASSNIMLSVQEAAKAIYSKLENVAATAYQGMKAQGVVNFLMKNGVKKAEMEAVGLDAFLADRKPTDKVTQDELLDFVRANTVELEDVVLGESGLHIEGEGLVVDEHPDGWAVYQMHDDSPIGGIYATEDEANAALAEMENDKPTHFAQYQEPGAVEGSYRELFVTAPDQTKARVQQINDEYDTIMKKHGVPVQELPPAARSRIDQLTKTHDIIADKTAPSWQDGHVEYRSIKNPVVRIRFNTVQADGKRLLRIEEMQGPSERDQANMPGYLRENIYQLGVKRIIAYAKENGFDGVALATKPNRTPGETQVDRYSLEKQVDTVRANRTASGNYQIFVKRIDGTAFEALGVKPEQELGEAVGKDLAKKIVNQPEGAIEYSGLDLKVGNEGLKQLYDHTLPKMLEAYGKGRMEEVKIQRPESVLPQEYKFGKVVPSFDSMPCLPLGNAPASFPMFSVAKNDSQPHWWGGLKETPAPPTPDDQPARPDQEHSAPIKKASGMTP